VFFARPEGCVGRAWWPRQSAILDQKSTCLKPISRSILLPDFAPPSAGFMGAVHTPVSSVGACGAWAWPAEPGCEPEAAASPRTPTQAGRRCGRKPALVSVLPEHRDHQFGFRRGVTPTNRRWDSSICPCWTCPAPGGSLPGRFRSCRKVDALQVLAAGGMKLPGLCYFVHAVGDCFPIRRVNGQSCLAGTWEALQQTFRKSAES